MSIAAACLVLIAIGSAYAALLKRKLAETFFLTAATVVSVLYCFGLLNFRGCLLYGVCSLVALALLCFVHMIVRFVILNNQHDMKDNLMTDYMSHILEFFFRLYSKESNHHQYSRF